MRRLIVVLAVSSVLASSCGTDGSPTGSIAPATPAQLKSKIASFEGKPLVVNYWATWCVPCTNEMPRIVAAASKYRGRVGFLGVNVEDEPGAASRFEQRFGMEFESLGDPNGKIRRAERILGLPVTQFYSSDGELAFLHNGEIDTEELEEKIEDLLSAAS
jgi:cytochrome c biogenesis protein CcmG/thiol:disulfide interchange protein DsbE